MSDEFRGHEPALLRALGISWRHGSRKHRRCPFPDHEDKHPSWRWDDGDSHWYCSGSCGNGDIFDAVVRMGNARGYIEAKDWCRQAIGKAEPVAKKTKPAPKLAEYAPATKRPPLEQLRHPVHGLPKPENVATYKFADGKIAELRVRYEHADGKEVVPWTLVGGRWTRKQMPGARPLYRLPVLLSKPDKPVLFVEGEGRKAKRAVELFPDYVVTATSGGCKGFAGMDYTPLAGRRVTVWPDNDAPGRQYARDVCTRALEAGAIEARIVDVPEWFCPAWDLGDDPGSIDTGDEASITTDDLREMLDEAILYHQGNSFSASSYLQSEGQCAISPIKSGIQQQTSENYRHCVGTVSGNGAENGATVISFAAASAARKPDAEWQRDEKGNLLKNEFNVLLAFTKLNVKLRFDEFSYEYRVGGLAGYGPVLGDDALDELYLSVAREFSLKPTKADFDRIALAEGRRQRFHPVRDYLGGLEWDGVERLDTWLCNYLGAQDDSAGVMRAIGRKVLIAAVRRVRDPGCKFDPMMVLEGPQYAGKSMTLATLCPQPEWFSDNVSLSMTQKELMETTAGKWIIEVGELSGMRKSEVEHVKAMLSRQVDEARMAYDRMKRKRPRQCVFVGTTNENHYLQDETGNRRFLPVRVGQIDIAALRRDRDQLWAEAAHFEAKKETLEFSAEVRNSLKSAQQEREVCDEWEGIVSAHLDETYPSVFALERDQKTTILDVFVSALGMEKGRLGSAEQKRIAKCMKRSGWELSQRSNGKRFWRRSESQNSAISPH